MHTSENSAPQFTGAASIVTTNPKTGERLGEFTVTRPEEVRAMVDRARAALPAWQKASFKQREKVFQSITRKIKNNARPLAETVGAETGKSLQDALKADLVTAIGIFSYYRKIGEKTLADERLPLDKSLLMGRFHVRRHVPKGVVGIVAPWNYPVGIPASGIAAALMAGNSVVLKPSELTPQSGIELVNIIRESLKENSFPEDLVQVAVGDGSTGATLTDSDIDHMIFTGSSAVGRSILASLSARHKTASMELGGNDPMVVLPGAKNLDEIASYALWGRFTNAGQACAAVKRLLVPAPMLDELVGILKTKLPGVPNAPVISQKQRDKLHAQVTQSVAQGAQVVAGGKPVDGPGFFYEPTLLVVPENLNPNEVTASAEETFGPVLSIIPYKTVKQAIEIANATEYGLTASVFGDDREAGLIARQIQAGTVVVNDTGAVNYTLPSVPWRGWKNSGPGASHGADALLELTVPQIVTSNRLRHVPGFSLMPWHFAKDAESMAGLDLAETLVDAYSGESLLEKLKPRLMRDLWANRSSKKL